MGHRFPSSTHSSCRDRVVIGTKDHIKIVRMVVRPVSISVMDALVRSKGSTELPLGYQAMKMTVASPLATIVIDPTACHANVALTVDQTTRILQIETDPLDLSHSPASLTISRATMFLGVGTLAPRLASVKTALRAILRRSQPSFCSRRSDPSLSGYRAAGDRQRRRWIPPRADGDHHRRGHTP